MNKFLFVISLCFCFSGSAQLQKEKPTQKNFERQYRYVKNKNYKGPENESYLSPANMSDEESSTYSGGSSGGNNGGTIQYSPQQIQKNRNRNGGGQGGNGAGGSGGGGSKPKNPEMGKPEPIEFDPPEMDGPDVDLPDVNTPSISTAFWKVLLFIILGVALVLLIFYIYKNYRPRDQKIKTQFSAEEWNPEEISKTELELRLEEAIRNGDYRECVRIYFTFILKEMIRLRRIRWKKDLTNYDYVLQSRSYQNHYGFEESVRIYDLVWYGEYEINEGEYKTLAVHLDRYYKQLNQENA